MSETGHSKNVSCSEHSCTCGNELSEDKFHLLHPDTSWQAGLRYAEEIGLGSRDYDLVKV